MEDCDKSLQEKNVEQGLPARGAEIGHLGLGLQCHIAAAPGQLTTVGSMSLGMLPAHFCNRHPNLNDL